MRRSVPTMLLLGILLAGCGQPPLAYVTAPDADIPLVLAWEAPLPAAALSSPTVADWNGDGTLDVVAAMGFFSPVPAKDYDPRIRDVFVLDGRDGSVLTGWSAGGVDASPVVVDLEGDGEPEVLVGLRERLALGIGRTASADLTSIRLNNWVTGPILHDVDGDGHLDIVAVTGGSEGSGDAPEDLYVSGRPGELIAWGPDLQVMWRTPLEEESYASPAVTPDGIAILGLGGQLHHGGNVSAYELANGTLRWSKPTATGVLASPVVIQTPAGRLAISLDWWGTVYAHAVDDGTPIWQAATHQIGWNTPATALLDGDATPDIITTGYRTPGLHFDHFEIGVNDKASLVAGNNGTIYAFDGAQGTVLWSHEAHGTTSSPVTADLDGDGRAEVLVVVTEGSEGIAGLDGHLLVLDGATGRALAKAHLRAGAVSTPLVQDLDGDGRPEIVIATVGTGTVTVLETLGESDPGVRWSMPQWRGNGRNDGQPV